MASDRQPTEISDRRSSERQELEAPVRLSLAGPIQGISDNLSQAGLLFFTDQEIRVEVEMEHGGERKQLTGKLIRVQQMNETTTGLAVELDEA